MENEVQRRAKLMSSAEVHEHRRPFVFHSGDVLAPRVKELSSSLEKLNGAKSFGLQQHRPGSMKHGVRKMGGQRFSRPEIFGIGELVLDTYLRIQKFHPKNYNLQTRHVLVPTTMPHPISLACKLHQSLAEDDIL